MKLFHVQVGKNVFDEGLKKQRPQNFYCDNVQPISEERLGPFSWFAVRIA